tara:strand:- start:327 stop:1397 length:1071 start_codon:yes stop_codon:yes gene_type:complete
MIKSNSPYYLTIPFVSTNTGLTSTSYTLSVWVWDGLKASVPTTASYTKTIYNPTGSVGNSEINIARLISDFIEFSPVQTTATSVVNGNNNQWVKVSVVYATTDSADGTTPQEVSTSLMSLGYSYGNEGQNVTAITNDTLIPTQDYKVDRQGMFCVPILVSESVNLPITVKSYPNNQINLAVTALATTTSGELVKLIWVKCSEAATDTYIEVVFNGQTTTLLLEDEYKYTPIDIVFQNKEGSQQVIPFFKEQKDSISITNDQFESDRGQPSVGNHQFVRFNVQGMAKLTVESGFVDEEMNDIFQEMFLSERIWIYDGTTYTPLDIKSKSFSKKTQLKDKLINYTIDFEKSYNLINNI